MSFTSITWARRELRRRKAGAKRKKKAAKGLTPSFPIHLDGATAATPRSTAAAATKG